MPVLIDDKMTRKTTHNSSSQKARAAHPYTSKTASFYRNQAQAQGAPSANAAVSKSTNPGVNGVNGVNGVAGAGVGSQTAPVDTSQVLRNTGSFQGLPKRQRPAASRAFKLALFSLLLSLIGLGVIFALQVEMKGAGAYLYLMVTVSAFIYIVATMVYVFLSTRKSR